MNKNHFISLRVAFGCSMLAGALFAVGSVGCGPKDDDSAPFMNGGSGGGSVNTGGTGGGSSSNGGTIGSNGGTTGNGSGGGGGAIVIPGNTGGTGGATGAGVTISNLETGFHYFDDKTPGVATGVTGAWFSYGDSTVGASLTPPAGMPFKPTMPGRSSMYAACLKGSGFSTWGAGLGFNLNDPGDGKGGSAVTSFNASPYTGFTFWAKAAAPLTVKFKVPMKSSDPAGKVCMGDTGAMACYNHPAKEVALTTEWAQYTVTFASLMQEAGWGLQMAFSPMEVFGVRVEVGKDAGMFDFCLDDVAFVK